MVIYSSCINSSFYFFGTLISRIASGIIQTISMFFHGYGINYKTAVFERKMRDFINLV
jgi:hypothetical protein